MLRTFLKWGTGPLAPSMSPILLGGGQLLRSVLWCTVDLLIGFHLIVRLSVSAHAAGALLAITFALSAIPDFFIARWLARKADPVAAALRMQFVFGILAFLSATLLFGESPVGSEWKLPYLYAVSIVFRFTYAGFDVAQNALVTLLPSPGRTASLFVTIKLFASSVGRLLAALLVAWAISIKTYSLTDVQALTVFSVPFLLAIYALSRASSRTGPAVSQSTFRFSHLPFAALALPVVATVCEVGLLGLAGRLMPLFPKMAGAASPSSLIVAMVCGTVAGPWLGFMAGPWRSRRLVLIAIAAASATSSAVALLHFPGTGFGLTLAAVYGVGLAMLTNSAWEQVSTVVRNHAEEHDVRIDAPAFAVVTTAIKTAIALSTSLFGLFLDDFRQGGADSLQAITIVLLIGGAGAGLALALGELPRKPRQRLDTSRVTQVA